MAKEKDLIHSFLHEGDRQALGELVLRHAGLVYSIAYRLTQDRTDAEDVCQDTARAVVKSIRNYQPEQDFVTWLRAVTVKAALYHRRRKHTWWRLWHRGAKERQPKWDTSVTDTSQREEATLILQQAVQDLPENLQAPVALHYFEKLSYQQVADILGLSKSTVQNRIESALAKLKKSLVKLGFSGLAPAVDELFVTSSLAMPVSVPPYLPGLMQKSAMLALDSIDSALAIKILSAGGTMIGSKTIAASVIVGTIAFAGGFGVSKALTQQAVGEPPETVQDFQAPGSDISSGFHDYEKEIAGLKSDREAISANYDRLQVETSLLKKQNSDLDAVLESVNREKAELINKLAASQQAGTDENDSRRTRFAEIKSLPQAEATLEELIQNQDVQGMAALVHHLLNMSEDGYPILFDVLMKALGRGQELEKIFGDGRGVYTFMKVLVDREQDVLDFAVYLTKNKDLDNLGELGQIVYGGAAMLASEGDTNPRILKDLQEELLDKLKSNLPSDAQKNYKIFRNYLAAAIMVPSDDIMQFLSLAAVDYPPILNDRNVFNILKDYCPDKLVPILEDMYNQDKEWRWKVNHLGMLSTLADSRVPKLIEIYLDKLMMAADAANIQTDNYQYYVGKIIETYLQKCPSEGPSFLTMMYSRYTAHQGVFLHSVNQSRIDNNSKLALLQEFRSLTHADNRERLLPSIELYIQNLEKQGK
ncbi:RNA polymerase sigma factor [Planctomycetota bacterium]